MTDLDVREYSDYDEFVREWHASDLDELGVSLEEARGQGRINEDDTRLRWQLLGQLDDDESSSRFPSGSPRKRSASLMVQRRRSSLDVSNEKPSKPSCSVIRRPPSR
jgi:hypothetical protein